MFKVVGCAIGIGIGIAARITFRVERNGVSE